MSVTRSFQARPPLQRGFALVIVLWTVSLLTVIAGSFSFAMRSEVKLAGNLVERAQADALADAGIQIALVRLAANLPEMRWRADGTVYDVELPAGQVRVAVRAEEGKIDLNLAQSDLLRGVVEQVVADVGAGDADAITDAILDWRDRNDERRLHGAEDSEYTGAGRPYGSRDGPFLSVNELTQVLGVTRELFEALIPMVTVYSGKPNVDPGSASAAVLKALPGITEESVAGFLADREVAAAANTKPATNRLAASAGSLSAPNSALGARSGVFSIVAEGGSGRAISRRSAVVRVRVSGGSRSARPNSTRGRLPYTVLAWFDDLPAGALDDAVVEAGAEPK